MAHEDGHIGLMSVSLLTKYDTPKLSFDFEHMRTLYEKEEHKHSQIFTESEKKARHKGLLEQHESEKIMNSLVTILLIT